MIDTNTNTKIGDDIPVGDGPSAIGVNGLKNTVYVANNDDDTVSVIDGLANKVVARVIFNTEPFNAGLIECDKDNLLAPIEKYFYVFSGTECTAKPNQGFEFVSWHENLNGNSTQLIQFSSSPSLLDSLSDIISMKREKPEATLSITKFGSFTANFKELPPPIPREYIATLFTVVFSAFVGSWLTPTVIEWRKSRRQGRKLGYYHNKINDLHGDDCLNLGDISELDKLRDTITDDYTRGRITKDQFEKLLEQIATKYREIFNNELHYLNKNLLSIKKEKLVNLKSIIEDSYAVGKINELQYNLLKEKLLGYEKK